MQSVAESFCRTTSQSSPREDHNYCSLPSTTTDTSVNNDRLHFEDANVYTETVESATIDPQPAPVASTSVDCTLLSPLQDAPQLHEPCTSCAYSFNTPRKQRYRQVINRLRVQLHRIGPRRRLWLKS